MSAIRISLPAFTPIWSATGTAGARRRLRTFTDWET